MTGSQLLLDLPVEPVMTFATLVVGEGNRLAVEAVERLLAEGQGALTLVGEAGTGKSHLLSAANTRCRGMGYTVACLDLALLLPHLERLGEGTLTRLLAEQARAKLVLVDGLEHLQASPGLQEAMLYLFNLVRNDSRSILMAGRHYPGQMITVREDLRSRLAWGPVITVDPPDESVLLAILEKLAADRQVRLSTSVVHYLMLRLPRRVPDLLAALTRIDQAALTRQRPITIHLAREVMGWS